MVLCLCFGPLLVTGGRASARDALDLTQYRGRVVYLDFWASWCAPCQQSFPWMQSLKSTYESRGLTVLAINLDRKRADADRFLAIRQTSFEVRFDAEGEIARAFAIQGMPTSIIIDRRGAVRFTHVGFKPADGSAYETQIQQLLAEN
jgi:cytochrome c biogenesis protein CcmG, thiol:disulfide interchange protein DsbE